MDFNGPLAALAHGDTTVLELLAQGGHYNDLYELQIRPVERDEQVSGSVDGEGGAS